LKKTKIKTVTTVTQTACCSIFIEYKYYFHTFFFPANEGSSFVGHADACLPLKCYSVHIVAGTMFKRHVVRSCGGMELELYAFVPRGELLVSLPGLFQSSKICSGTYWDRGYL